VDTPNRNQLIAAKHSLPAMTRMIGCDYLGFLSLSNLVKCCGGTAKFCSGCFDGKYPIRKPSLKK
jgi:amidophosphoribosyltransferase